MLADEWHHDTHLPVPSDVFAGVSPAAAPTVDTHSCSSMTASILPPNLQEAVVRAAPAGRQG